MVASIHTQRLRRQVAVKGRPMLLRRAIALGNTVAVALNGITVRFKGEEDKGDIRQGDWAVWITNDEIAAADWPAPPKPRDVLVIDGNSWQVQAVESLYEGAAIAGYRMQVRGG